MKGRLAIKVYQAGNGDYHWRIKAHNGEIVADGSEGYKRKDGAKRAVKRLVSMIERGLYDVEWEEGKVE